MLHMLKKKLVRKKKTEDVLQTWRNRLTLSPTSAELHAQYAQAAAQQGMAYLAHAEMKTAAFLGLDSTMAQQALNDFRQALPDLLEMNHNQWFRLHTLAGKLAEKKGSLEKISVLDVGGGEGWLSAFIPEMDYCLVEPDINGISGIDMPFADNSFDYVISCHVLEHIPPESREAYLDQLVAKARNGVILLNPFHEEGTRAEDRLQLFIDITNARWAHEHLACSLPKVSDVELYAASRGLKCTVEPNGTMSTTVALIFMDYFAAETGRHADWKTINRFINTHYADSMTSISHPAAYMICMDKT